ncbi:MAG TPA: hypothetical protein VHP83_17290 [Aggregatilineaceae bacterium]|nr:hypothetical protein [Aggregatilineaceae bacterium]
MNTRTRFQYDWLRSSTALLIGLALLKIIVHLLVNGQYGFFRDELSYIDDGKHLAWGGMSIIRRSPRGWRRFRGWCLGPPP